MADLGEGEDLPARGRPSWIHGVSTVLLARLALVTGRAYREWALRRLDGSVGGAVRAAFRIVRRKRYCVLVTGGDGSPVRARVVEPLRPAQGGTICIGTDPGSRKVADVRSSGRCLLVYEDDRRLAAVSLSCAAAVIDDPRILPNYFMPAWSAFWTQGPVADFAAIVCTPVALEVWDGLHGITPAPFGRASTRLVRLNGTWVADHVGQRVGGVDAQAR